MAGSAQYLQLLQGFSNDGLTGGLLLAKGHEPFNGLLEGFSLNCEMGRLHDNQQKVIHLQGQSNTGHEITPTAP